MTQIILDHGVSGCFGTSLAPKERGGPIEPNSLLTYGFRIPDRRTSDNLIREEIINQGAPDNGACFVLVAEGARFENT